MLLSIAYNMLGDRAEAEDIVQDVLLRWEQTSKEAVRNAKSYLVKATVNSVLNYRASAHKQRLTYPNIWLPEPLPDAVVPMDTPAGEIRSALTYELMVLIRELSPDELAVFVLKEAFDFSHEEIGEILDKRPDHSRQLLKRAREKVGRASNSRSPLNESDLELAQRVVEAISRADVDALRALFTTDIRLVADGGGKVAASPAPILGSEKVAHLLVTAARKTDFTPRFEILFLNRQPAFLVYREQEPLGAFILTPAEGRVERMYAVLNPDKLRSFPGA
ncbi:MAG TPA: sigma-70 family RNA polymerase sigma factor [Bacteroidota bacterium]|nr:sigma-70 family RNA polymerase sigma factor [Bacteroidota bacterium]